MMNLEKMKQKKSKNSVKKGLLAATTILCLTSPMLQTQSVLAAENTAPAITIEKPDGWRQGETAVAITVDASHMPEGFSITKIEAKAGKDGSWQDVTGNGSISITGNQTVYVRVTDGETADSVTKTATEGTKEFYTISTKSGKIFYLIIDNSKSQDNVYFLTEVSEKDLMNFTLSDSVTLPEVDIVYAEPEKQAEEEKPETTETDEKDKVEDEIQMPEDKSLAGTYLLIGLVAVGAAAGGYYLKVYKPKHEYDDEDEMEEDENESEDSESEKREVDDADEQEEQENAGTEVLKDEDFNDEVLEDEEEEQE